MKKFVIAIVVLAICAFSYPPVQAASEAEIEEAIAKGLGWLADRQNGDGSWGYDDRVAHTGLAVKKFEHHAIETGYNPLDPAYEYYPQVKDGLNYLFSEACVGMVVGVYLVDGDCNNTSHRTYSTGIALMAIAESDCPDSVVDVPGSPVDGITYYDLASNILDYLVYSQNDATTGNGEGGWLYSDNEPYSDNSNSGYAVLGIAYAASPSPYGFGIPIPQTLKDKLQKWIEYIQCDVTDPFHDGSTDGGSGYANEPYWGGPCEWVNVLKTGNLLFEMALCNITSGSRFDRAIDYLIRHWNDPYVDPGWRGNPPCYQSMYCIMKGLEFQGITGLIPNSTIDWYEDFSDEIVQNQVDSAWLNCNWGDEILCTEWALLTLEKAAPPPPPSSCAEIKIEKAHDVLQGHFEYVSITIENSELEMGGFDFLIGYDASALAFMEATPGQLLEDCGWEYFTYRYGFDGNCGDACPSGLLRIVAIAETNNGPNHPSCYGPPDTDPHELVEIKFYVTNDRTFNCQFAPIRFFWVDCMDNSISDVSGDTLFVSDHVYDFEGTDITDSTYGFPTYFGIQQGCLEGGGPDKPAPLSCIYFIDGGIDIICSDSIDVRGDINVNGVPNEIADAVMFTNYFISGLSAFGNHVEASIAASDVNADGIALSVADLVYMIRVIIGDASPYPKPVPNASAVITQQGAEVRLKASVDIGAVLLTFEANGSVTPELGVDMDMKYGQTGNELRVLIYDIGNRGIDAGETTLLTIPGATLTGAEVASYDGFTVETLVDVKPTSYALLQNAPNPFNPSTMIAFNMPVEADWTIEVFNVAGQLVRDYSGHSQAGTVEVMWDGMDNAGKSVASGIYLYRVRTDQFSETKKMVLMK